MLPLVLQSSWNDKLRPYLLTDTNTFISMLFQTKPKYHILFSQGYNPNMNIMHKIISYIKLKTTQCN
jgi:hypothetical protein